MERLALGVDGGGTKSDAVLMDEQGAVLGWGRSGTGQGLWAGHDAALENYSLAVRDALGGRRPRDLWVAGLYDRVLDLLDLKKTEIHWVRAGELTRGLATGMVTHGILVLSGTGAFVAALTETGEHLTFDGLGPVLGDRGSGYQIGLMGMRAAMTASWGPERATVLEQAVPLGLGVANANEVFNLVYYEQIGRSRIASAAKAVIDAAEDGDRVAGEIVLQAADDISETLADVIARMSLQESDYALVASGGIAQTCAMYWDRVCERALAIAPNLRPVRPMVRPCIGAGLLALKDMGVSWTPDLLARIEETQKPFLDKLDRQ
ncbi:MAG: hypothetical protein KBC96_05690 [Armatimonadetes bacterium]|nr:hypothetical protein [Armatimonadota bacterium]